MPTRDPGNNSFVWVIDFTEVLGGCYCKNCCRYAFPTLVPILNVGLFSKKIYIIYRYVILHDSTHVFESLLRQLRNYAYSKRNVIGA
jgi:hypothetical protein